MSSEERRCGCGCSRDEHSKWDGQCEVCGDGCTGFAELRAPAPDPARVEAEHDGERAKNPWWWPGNYRDKAEVEAELERAIEPIGDTTTRLTIRDLNGDSYSFVPESALTEARDRADWWERQCGHYERLAAQARSEVTEAREEAIEYEAAMNAAVSGELEERLEALVERLDAEGKFHTDSLAIKLLLGQEARADELRKEVGELRETLKRALGCIEATDGALGAEPARQALARTEEDMTPAERARHELGNDAIQH